MQLAGQISENFPQNIFIGTQFENLWKFSEIQELGQNSENFLLIRLCPVLKDSLSSLKMAQTELGNNP